MYSAIPRIIRPGPVASDARLLDLVSLLQGVSSSKTDKVLSEYEAPPAPPKAFANNGDSDVSTDNTPSQFLLIRGLETTTTEEILAKGVCKLYKPSANSSQSTAASANKKGFKVASTTGDANLGAKEGSLRRVLLVHDRRSDDSWRYGFAEFASVDVNRVPSCLVHTF